MTRSDILTLCTGFLLAGATAACGERSTTPAEPATTLPTSAGEHAEAPLPAPAPEPVVAQVEPETAEALDAPTPELFEVDGVSLRRLVVARGIEDREPVEHGVGFAAQERPMYAFLDVQNRTDEDRLLQVTFEDEAGTAVGHVELDIPAEAPRWRTWMRSRMVTTPGRWNAIVRDGSGELLGRVAFDLEG